jgi:hypothetical protein
MRRIQEGDVIAVAVDGVKSPPVGLVSEADDDAFILNLFQWHIGVFGGGQMLIRRRDVRATLWAEPMTESQLSEYHYRDPDTVTYDMDPLGQFQSAWKVK